MSKPETLGAVVKTIVSPRVTFAVALVSAAVTCVEKLDMQNKSSLQSTENPAALRELKTV